MNRQRQRHSTPDNVDGSLIATTQSHANDIAGIDMKRQPDDDAYRQPDAVNHP